MEWYRCSDVMPVCRVDVLCHTTAVYDGWDVRRIMFWDGVVWHAPGTVYPPKLVSHWCYLPETPEEDDYEH